MTSCGEWVLSKLTDLPIVAVRILLRRHIADHWVLPLANDGYDVFPDAMTAVLKRAGLPFRWSTASGRSSVADWAMRHPDEDVVLGTHGHVVLARNNLIFDNLHPGGLPPGQHPYGEKRVALGRICWPEATRISAARNVS